MVFEKKRVFFQIEKTHKNIMDFVETKMRACRHSIGDFDLRTSLLDDLLKKSVFSMFCFACYLRIFRIMRFSCPKRRGTT